MRVVPARLLLTVAAVAALAGPAPADAPADKGKRRLVALFADAVAAAGPSVARVRCDDKDVALATVVRADGYLLTKGSELKGDVSVTLRDGAAFDAKRVAYHKPTDLALLKIDADKLSPVTFADDAAAEVGNWVAAVGAGSDPLGVGVVSVAARKLYREQAQIGNGNKGYLGVMFGDATGSDTVVNKLARPGGALAAGIRPGDVIRKVDGKAVDTRDALLELLDGYKPGDRVTVVLDRDGAEVEVVVRLQGSPDRSVIQNSMGGAMSGRRTGFPKVIQHDTVVKPADCGGPLVDLEGRVLGVNIARAGRVETWALPASVVGPAVREMLDGKHAVGK